jgi:hypothetical protein
MSFCAVRTEARKKLCWRKHRRLVGEVHAGS